MIQVFNGVDDPTRITTSTSSPTYATDTAEYQMGTTTHFVLPSAKPQRTARQIRTAFRETGQSADMGE